MMKSNQFIQQHSPTASAGFTLVELVVALSVLAIGMAGVAQVNKAALETARIAYEYQEASQLAGSHLYSLELQAELEHGEFKGQYLSSRPDYYYPWKLRVKAIDPAALPEGLTELSSKVTALEVTLLVGLDSGQRSVDFATLLLRPDSTQRK